MTCTPSLRWWLLPLLLTVGCECDRSPPAVAALLHEGEPCTTDARCETDLCDGLAGAQPVCLRQCGQGCLEGQVCTQLVPNRFACLPDPRRLCLVCQQDSDCAYPGDKCLLVNGEKVCGRDCAFDQLCPKGYRCLNGMGVDGNPKLQQCVPENASCSCLSRGDFNQPCEVTNSFGTCRGTKACDLVLNTVACDARTPSAETCNAVDDDCDSQVDDGLPASRCGEGVCAREVASCEAGKEVACVQGNPTVETCNGLDDDCDGQADDGIDLSSDLSNCGACANLCQLPHSTPTCSNGGCRVQACDANWGDCDLKDPTGCEADLLNNSLHCGGCNSPCALINGSGACVNGQCQLSCNAGFYDLNKNSADGCEYACTLVAGPDLPDLELIDGNCDGLDGEWSKGLFVSPQGDDSQPGTALLPKKTVNAALSAANLQGKRDLYVAAGSYPGSLELSGTAGMNVAGGYDPVSWTRNRATPSTLQAGNPGLKLDGAANVLVQLFTIEGASPTLAGESAYGVFVKDSSSVRLEGLVVKAGAGAIGAAGLDGAQGTGGEAGATGAEGCVDDPTLACYLIDHCDRPTSSSGGTSACGEAGGAGGRGSRDDLACTAGNVGEDGTPAPSGAAGGKGTATCQADSVPANAHGAKGANGQPGSNGAGGQLGSFDGTGYRATGGTTGTGGTFGKGGGGGGGGGGGINSLLYTTPNCSTWGSSGGGGGGGGCGGLAGQGGGAGGASIGIYLWNSTVTATSVEVFTGAGGKGGTGGAQGPGGPGGPGGPSNYVGDEQGRASRGGNGGAGGNGGSGGAGGGGAGGPAYTLARNAGSTWNPVSGILFHAGTPGAGGTSTGVQGQPGTSGSVHAF